MSDVDVRSGGLVAVDTDTLRSLAATLTLSAARLEEAADALGRAASSSLAAGLWVPSPQSTVREAEACATDLAQALRTLAEIYEVAEREALARIGGARGDAAMAAIAARLQARHEVGEAAARLAGAWLDGRHDEIERQMRAASPMLGVYGPLAPALTLLTTGVRTAGRGVVLAGDPPLRSAGAVASVVELDRHLSAGVDAAPRGLADVVDRMPGQDGLKEGRVRVEEYRHPSGEREFAVYIAGTRSLIDADEPWNMTANLQLYFGEESSSYVAVEQALAAAGAVAGDRLHVFGHSQGAMIGAHLARQGDFDVVTEIGFGSPIQAELPDDVLAVSVRHGDDPVAALAAGGIPGVAGSADSLVIERIVDPAPRWSDVAFTVHQLDAYRETAAAVDASTDGRADALRERFATLAGAAMVTSIVYGAHRAPPPLPDRRRRTGGGGGV